MEPTKPLSPREREILVLVAEGCTNRQIGNRLGITKETAKSLLKRATNKLRARGRTNTVIRALKSGILTLDELA